MQYEQIAYEVTQKRAIITLNRPEQRNALSLRLHEELAHALLEADEDDAVSCIILRGAGKDFCGGVDLKELDYKRGPGYRGAAEIADDSWHLERQTRLRMTILDVYKPVVAQIHGTCIAGGTDLALLCDFIIVADDARIGHPPVRDLGSPPNQMWLYHCGPQWAKRFLLTGDCVTGKDAVGLGLALMSAPADRLEAEVNALVDRMVLIDHHLLAANKRIVNLGLELMGMRTLQRLASENDARGHRAPSTRRFRKTLQEKGVREAVADRDGQFGDGYIRFSAPGVAAPSSYSDGTDPAK